MRLLQQKVLVQDIVSEIKTELHEAAENCVIQRCQEKFRELLMTGPFQCATSSGGDLQRQQSSEESKRNKKGKEEVIKGREQLNVMGVILHQIDSMNQIVSCAVVDQFGELVVHKDFMHLMPPRKMGEKRMQAMANDEDKEKMKKIRMAQAEEQEEHNKDIEKIKQLIHRHSVDLIVVGANKLEARRIFETLKEIAG